MFRELGTKLDNFIVDVACFNRKFFWYKIFAYYYVKRNLKLKLIESAYHCRCIYKWQYKRLLKIMEEKI